MMRLLLLLLLFLLLRLSQGAKCKNRHYHDSQTNRCRPCQSPCSECTSETSCTNCLTGYYKSYYWEECEPCRESCASCGDWNTCYTCTPGYYDDGSNMCLVCPIGCISCTNASQCSSCKTGFVGEACELCVEGQWGTDCNKTCSSNCIDCERGNGYCNTCNDGYFLQNSSNSRNCMPCHFGCGNCTNPRECLSCKPGFTGNECEECDVGRFGRDCESPCRSFCKNNTCRRTNGLCTDCPDKFYLNAYEECVPCPKGCALCNSSKQCSSCESGYTGVICDRCAEGKYGTYCDHDCAANCQTCVSDSHCSLCKHGFYNKRTLLGQYLSHTCSHSCPDRCTSCISLINCTECTSVYITGSTCQDCASGRYGDSCEHACPKHCSNNTCDRHTGNCFSCSPSYTGDKCEHCTEGKFGGNCDKTCPVNCLISTCDRQTGSCIGQCVTGYHGDMCEKMCSGNCINTTCGRKNGTCLLGCLPGFTGENCSEDASGETLTSIALVGIAAAGIAAAGTLGIVIIVFFLVVLTIKSKRKTRENRRESDAVSDSRTADRRHQEVNVSVNRAMGDGREYEEIPARSDGDIETHLGVEVARQRKLTMEESRKENDDAPFSRAADGREYEEIPARSGEVVENDPEGGEEAQQRKLTMEESRKENDDAPFSRAADGREYEEIPARSGGVVKNDPEGVEVLRDDRATAAAEKSRTEYDTDISFCRAGATESRMECDTDISFSRTEYDTASVRRAAKVSREYEEIHERDQKLEPGPRINVYNPLNLPAEPFESGYTALDHIEQHTSNYAIGETGTPTSRQHQKLPDSRAEEKTLPEREGVQEGGQVDDGRQCEVLTGDREHEKGQELEIVRGDREEEDENRKENDDESVSRAMEDGREYEEIPARSGGVVQNDPEGSEVVRDDRAAVEESRTEYDTDISFCRAGATESRTEYDTDISFSRTEYDTASVRRAAKVSREYEEIHERDQKLEPGPRINVYNPLNLPAEPFESGYTALDHIEQHTSNYAIGETGTPTSRQHQGLPDSRAEEKTLPEREGVQEGRQVDDGRQCEVLTGDREHEKGQELEIVRGDREGENENRKGNDDESVSRAAGDGGPDGEELPDGDQKLEAEQRGNIYNTLNLPAGPLESGYSAVDQYEQPKSEYEIMDKSRPTSQEYVNTVLSS